MSTLNRVLARQEKEIIETALEECYRQVSGPSGAAKQAPHVWRYVVIEIIRVLPVNLFATRVIMALPFRLLDAWPMSARRSKREP